MQLFPHGVQELFELVFTYPEVQLAIRHWLSIRVYGEAQDKQSYMDPLLQVLHGDTQLKQLVLSSERNCRVAQLLLQLGTVYLGLEQLKQVVDDEQVLHFNAHF